MIRRLLSALIALAIVVVALLTWRLSQGPVPLDFMTPYLEAALRDAQGDWRLDIQEVVLMSDLRLHARAVSLLDAQDKTILSVPDLVVRPSLRALTHGLVAIEAIELSGAEAAVVRHADGTFGVSVAGAPQEAPATEAAGDFVEELLQPANTDYAIGFLHRVRIIDARIRIEDENGASWSVDNVRIGLVRSSEEQRLSLVATIAAGKNGGAPAAVDAQLSLRPSGDGFALQGQAKAGPIDVSQLRLYWPQNAAVGARRWVTENIPKGTVPEAVVDLAMDSKSGADFDLTRLTGSFRYDGLEVRWSDKAPTVTGVTGTSTFDRSSMHFKIAGGRSGEINVQSATVDLLGLDGDKERLELALIGAGPFAAALALIPGEKKVPVQTQGNAKLRVNAAFPLRPKLEFADVFLKVDAEPIALKVNHNAGSAVVAGTLRYQKAAKGAPTLVADLDLRDARLDSTLDWVQPAGSNGKVGFHVQPTAEPLKFDPLHIDFPDLSAHGTVAVGNSGASGSATLVNVSLGKTELDRVEAQWTPTANAVRIGRGTLDLQPLLKEDGGQKGAAAPTQPTDLDLNINGGLRISLDRNSWMENVKANLVRRHGEFQRIDVSAELPRKLWSTGPATSATGSTRSFWLKLEPSGPGRRLDAAAPDFGAMLKALDVSNGVRGGILVISGRADKMETGDVVRSHVKVTDFVMAEAPLVVRILTVAALDRFVSTVRGEGLHFDSLKGTVIARGERYELVDFRAYGSSVGFTAAGWVDIGIDELSIDGAVIPAYTANQFMKNIPLLGSLFVGKDSRGLIAINYKVRGALKDPKVTANPLSALTPGILRGLWEIGE